MIQQYMDIFQHVAIAMVANIPYVFAIYLIFYFVSSLLFDR